MSPNIKYHLKIGSRFTGITLQQDPKYPSMFRIHANDGRVSDMVNLTRAKDAAISWYLRSTNRSGGLSKGETIHWDCRETPTEDQAAE